MPTKLDLHILDSASQVNQTNMSDCNIIYWESYLGSEQDGVFSISHLVEQNASNLKASYLKLIYDFGEAKINDKRVIDLLTIRSNYSYWWSTLFNEKCNYAKSPQIDNIVKMLALEEFLKINKYSKIKLITSNKNLAKSISLLAKKLSIDFDFIFNKNKKNKQALQSKFLRFLPNIIRSPIWLVHFFITNMALKDVGSEEWRKTLATTTFVSYFFNLDQGLAEKDRYSSPYWTKLTDLMGDNKYPSNWLHIYLKDNLLPSAKEASELLQRFNRVKNGVQVHITLSCFISRVVFFKSLKDWLAIYKLKRPIGKKLRSCSGYLWPLFKGDFKESFSGPLSLNYLLYLNLFEKAMNELPVQERGCYLQENQGWEFGLISAWKSAGHGNNLMGVSHSSVRFWDLRYFFDSQIYKSKNKNDMPLPNFLAVNGSEMKKVLIEGGCPENILVELEALRYLYLSKYNVKKIISNKPSKNKVVLILTDYLKTNTDKQLKLLTMAQKGLDKSILYIVKPHPSHNINLNDFPDINLEISKKTLPELLAISDIVYSSSTTSGAIDAYCSGLPIIVLNDAQILPQSPLRGFKDVHFSSSANDLADKITNVNLLISQDRVDFFDINLSLPKWSKWLNIISKTK